MSALRGGTVKKSPVSGDSDDESGTDDGDDDTSDTNTDTEDES